MTARPTGTSVAVHAALIALAILTALPLVWMVSASLMPAGAASALPPPFWPRGVTFEHYRALFATADMGRYLLNSLLLSATVTAGSLLFNSATFLASVIFQRACRSSPLNSRVSAVFMAARSIQARHSRRVCTDLTSSV